mgnify:CR=1 FL=1
MIACATKLPRLLLQRKITSQAGRCAYNTWQVDTDVTDITSHRVNTYIQMGLCH